MKKILLACPALFLFLGLNAQHLTTQQAPLPCLNKKFSIVVHTVLNELGNPEISEATVQLQVDTLNKYFEPICASFEICEFRYIDNYNYNIVGDTVPWEELKVLHHQKNRINLFLVNRIDFKLYDCGHTDIGGIAHTDSLGLLVKKGCMASDPKTLAHDMGHYFGLYNTNEGEGSELVDGSNCETEGDFICDTPSDPYVIGDTLTKYINVDLGCRFINTKRDANGAFYTPHVANIMSYYPSSCKCNFSWQQYFRMAETYLLSVGMW